MRARRRQKLTAEAIIGCMVFKKLLGSLDAHVDRMPRNMLGHLGPKKLEQLAVLLDLALSDLGTFP